MGSDFLYIIPMYKNQKLVNQKKNKIKFKSELSWVFDSISKIQNTSECFLSLFQTGPILIVRLSYHPSYQRTCNVMIRTQVITQQTDQRVLKFIRELPYPACLAHDSQLRYVTLFAGALWSSSSFKLGVKSRRRPAGSLTDQECFITVETTFYYSSDFADTVWNHVNLHNCHIRSISYIWNNVQHDF